MIGVRWRKISRELLLNKGRTILVAVAIAVGVLAFGSVYITQDLLIKNMHTAFVESNGASITLYLTEFDDSLVQYVQEFEGVSQVQGRAMANATITLGKTEKTLAMTAVPDYGKQKLNLLEPKLGTWPPQKNEIFLERSGYTAVGIKIGEPITVRTADGRDKELILAGTVYDNNAFPYMFTQQPEGYISWQTLGYLGYPRQYSQLLIQVGPEIVTLADAERLTDEITQSLKDRGIQINGSMVLPPHEHWAEKNSNAFIAILSMIGVFSLVLSGFLVVNTISAILAQNKKQIGIMKAIGALPRDIVGLYLVMVSLYGTIALLLAVPLGLLLGYGFFVMVAKFLNLDSGTIYLPPQVLAMEIAAAYLVPMAAALWPIMASSKVTIRESLSEFSSVRKIGWTDRLLAKLSQLPRPVLLSFRNVFRKKGRLILTLGTLVTAGAVFMAVINVRKGMYLEIDRLMALYDFGVLVQLGKDYASESVIARTETLPHVTEAETRSHMSGKRIKTDGTLGAQFGIDGVDPETVFSHPVILSGRWLQDGDTTQAVIGSSYQKDNPDLSIGSDLYIDTGSEKKHVEVVGIAVTSTEDKTIFMEQSQVSAMKDRPGQASTLLLKTDADDQKTQEDTAIAAKDILERAGITVAGSQTRYAIESSAASQFNFMIFFLLSMAVLIAVVGGLGLAGTMSLNVLERTREIGIMRSIGAGDGAVRQLVLYEGISTGIISFLLSIPLSLPITYLFCYSVGQGFFARTLPFAIVPAGSAIWLAIVLTIAAVASLIPARKAARMSISETLSYE